MINQPFADVIKWQYTEAHFNLYLFNLTCYACLCHAFSTTVEAPLWHSDTFLVLALYQLIGLPERLRIYYEI